MNQNSKGALGVVMLLVTAMIWGSAFVAQALGMESLGAFSFGSIRTLLQFSHFLLLTGNQVFKILLHSCFTSMLDKFVFDFCFFKLQEFLTVIVQ